MLFERVIVKQKESVAIPDGDVIRVIERITVDNGMNGDKHRIRRKTIESVVDRETGMRIGEPKVETMYLKEMPQFGEAIWDIRSSDTTRQIRENIRKFMQEDEVEKRRAEEKAEAEEIRKVVSETLKSRSEKPHDEPVKLPVKPAEKPVTRRGIVKVDFSA